MVPSRQLFTFQFPYQSDLRLLMEPLSLKSTGILFLSYSRYKYIGTMWTKIRSRRDTNVDKNLFGHELRGI